MQANMRQRKGARGPRLGAILMGTIVILACAATIANYGYYHQVRRARMVLPEELLSDLVEVAREIPKLMRVMWSWASFRYV